MQVLLKLALCNRDNVADALEVIQPSPCSEQCRLPQAADDHVQSGFEYLQGWRTHSFSGQPAPVFDSTHMENLLPGM